MYIPTFHKKATQIVVENSIKMEKEQEWGEKKTPNLPILLGMADMPFSNIAEAN